MKPVTYADSGVDIDRGEEAVDRITRAAHRTHKPGVLAGIGGFGALFALRDAFTDLVDPVLVSGTDGVGTKLLVAIEANEHGSIGQDLVAMCVNDILTLGAKPLFFLDYFATGKLAPEHMATVVTGIAEACEKTGCALVGGETAELPGMYAKGHYDLAGFAVGMVERAAIIDGTRVREGDVVLGLASSGLHSNGYSLARKVVFDRMKKGLDDVLFESHGASVTTREALLVPTRLYVNAIRALIEAKIVDVRAMAHITGGGLPLNATRAFPKGLTAKLDRSAWREPPIFDVLRQGGPVEEHEMLRTFNCGIGFVVVVPSSDVDAALTLLRAQGEEVNVIGEVVPGEEVLFAG